MRSDPPGPDAVARRGSRREVSVLVVDLGGFSALAERNAPELVVAHLNEYFEAVCEIALVTDGTVNERLGEGILTFWGAPLEQPDHAACACAAALRCRERLAALAADWRARGTGELRFRLGAHTGVAVVGELGTARRRSYGVVGDAVDLARRLERANEDLGTTLLVSEATRERAGAAFEFREVERVRVAGRAAALAVFEPLGRTGGVPAEQLAERDCYADALAAYRTRDFARAEAILADLLGRAPDDGPARALFARAGALRERPPPAEWDAVLELATR